MKVVMTPEELRDYIRFMPDDEILSITIEYRALKFAVVAMGMFLCCLTDKKL